VLSEVITISHHEAKVTTEAARVAGSTDAAMLRFCDAVEALIATTKPVEYYTAWVIIETADID